MVSCLKCGLQENQAFPFVSVQQEYSVLLVDIFTAQRHCEAASVDFRLAPMMLNSWQEREHLNVIITLSSTETLYDDLFTYFACFSVTLCGPHCGGI